MKKSLTSRPLTLLALLIFSAFSTASAGPPEIKPGEILVKFKNRASRQVRSDALARFSIKNAKKIKNLQLIKLEDQGRMTEVLKRLNQDPNVEFAEPNYRRYRRAIPNDPAFDEQWGLKNDGQVVVLPSIAGADGKVAQAWELTTGSRQVIVAVIDDSLDIEHPDLKDNIWTNPGEIAGNGIDDDHNGFVDDVRGWDFVNGDNNPQADPGAEEGHGTMVAGILGAVGDNAIGVSGVSQRVSIMALKFGMDVAGEVEALEYAKNKGSSIINASWGGAEYSQAEYDAIKELEEAGILLVVAAGNYSVDNDRQADYPSGLDLPNIISVAASRPDDQLTSFTHYGALNVDIAAPGVHMLTTRSANEADNIEKAEYGYAAGTSFSAPFVAGAAALIKALYPAASYSELRGRITDGADQLAQFQNRLSTSGRINVDNSLRAASRPTLIIAKISLDDSGGNQNKQLDPDEAIKLTATLENIRLKAANVSATLNCDDSDITLAKNSAVYPDIDAGRRAAPLAPFELNVGNETRRRLINCSLAIAAANYSAERHFQLNMGSLKSGALNNETISANAFDNNRHFYINLPPGADQLTIEINADQDLDIKARYDLEYSAENSRAQTDNWASMGMGGQEKIQIYNPKAGNYHIKVNNNSDQKNTPYTLKAEIKVTQGLRLSAGWNMISPPLKTEQDINNFFSPANFSTGNRPFSAVWQWNPTAQNWKVHSPTESLEQINARLKANFEALTTLRPGIGYWLKLSQHTVFKPPPSGDHPLIINLSLKKGWNLAGYSGENNIAASELFKTDNFSAGQPLKEIWVWNNDAQKWLVHSPDESLEELENRLGGDFDSLTEISPGTGFWIRLKEDSGFQFTE